MNTTMRNVMVYKNVRTKDLSGAVQWKWERQEAGIGKFHSWGLDYEEFENGPGNVSVAIVEMEDGSIMMPRADMVKFIN